MRRSPTIGASLSTSRRSGAVDPMNSSKTSSYCSFSTPGATPETTDGNAFSTSPHGPQLHFQKSDANTSASGWLDNMKRHHWLPPHGNVLLPAFISEATKAAEHLPLEVPPISTPHPSVVKTNLSDCHTCGRTNIPL